MTVNKTIERTEGSNTIKLPLSDFIEDGDVITSFTFTIYSGDGANIGTFKGGCGLSVSSECSSATDEGWYQSEDFSAETEGTYGEITWNVPADVGKCAASGGEVLFGYWWGNAASIRIESAVCTFTRTREISVDGTVDRQVGKSVGFSDTDNTIKVPTDFLPDGAVPEAVIYNVSSSESSREHSDTARPRAITSRATQPYSQIAQIFHSHGSSLTKLNNTPQRTVR